MLKKFALVAVSTLALSACGDQGVTGAAAARDQIKVVGSSTVFPFATAVAEQFVNKNPGMKAPVIESTGTGAGMKQFCAGLGANHPDIANASRRMKLAEFEDCQKNGVKDVVEVQVGIDGLAFVESIKGPSIKLTPEEVYKALAANPYGKPNTAKTWKDVNPALPAIAIQVYGPPSTSGTRDALAELILEKGCDANPEMKALKAEDSDKHKDICTRVREDGAYVDSGENDNLIIQKLGANPNAVGVLGYSFLEENLASVRGIALSGVAPTYETISDFSYPGARPLYIYVKAGHLNAIKGLREYVSEWSNSWAGEGYLAKRGLISSPEAVRTANADVVAKMTPLEGAALK